MRSDKNLTIMDTVKFIVIVVCIILVTNFIYILIKFMIAVFLISMIVGIMLLLHRGFIEIFKK